MKITPGITWGSGDTVTHTKLNNFLVNATITSGAVDQISLGDSSLDSLTTGANNVGIGDNAGTALTDGDDNVMLGDNVLKTSTSALNNVALGNNAMANATGSPNGNVAVGENALLSITGNSGASEGMANIGVGHGAGDAITTGSWNTLMGLSAGGAVTSGDGNIAVGASALSTCITSDYNVAIGGNALKDATSEKNVAVGLEALANVSSGTDNVGVGAFAGQQLTTVDDCTFIGDLAGYNQTGAQNTALGASSGAFASTATYANTTAIGYLAAATASNQVVLGNGSITDLKCADDSVSTSSDKRIKKSVKDNKIGLAFVNALRTVSFNKVNPYNWPDEIKEERFKGIGPDNEKAKKPADDNMLRHGFIAQEVKEVMDSQGITEWRGHRIDPNGMQNIAYSSLVVPLVKAVQELSAKVTALEAAG